jgi:serine phosphatase RsbU (regulator of sigma subunit)
MATDLPSLLESASSAREALATLIEQNLDPGDERLRAAERAVETTAVAARRGWGRTIGYGLGLLVIVYFLFIQSGRLETRQRVVSSATAMIVLLGGLLLASRLVLQRAMPDRDLPLWGIVDLLILHLAACFVLPWRPKESVLPFTLLLLVWSVTFLVPHLPDSEFSILDRVVAVIVSPVILIPGVLVAGSRWRRLEEEAERLALGQQVKTIGGELSKARIVHDAMFPVPFDSGHLRFDYDYRPIAEIGGDYVHLNVCRTSGRICITLLDVAGHGLAAALTVNRLFGELERIRAEDPDAEPTRVMELLNRYIHLTMAAHSMYATGTCIMLDPATGQLQWVNAGHPPALLRKGSGQVVDLPGTTMLLGALSYTEFQPNQRSMSMEPGDVLLAYTDGAFEARNRAGQRFGMDKLRQTACFNPPPRDWTRFIANAVSNHHGGHAEDDVLVVSLQLRSLRLAELYHEEDDVELGVKVEPAR